jgi:hypothetical protein
MALTSMAEAELLGPPREDGAGPAAVSAVATEKPSLHLTEALKLCEDVLAPDDPYLGWVLMQLGRCYHMAGQAVTAEGLFR